MEPGAPAAPSPRKGPLADAGWVLLGMLLGTGLCCAVASPLVLFATIDTTSLASLTVLALLLGSVRHPQTPPSAFARD